MSDGDETGTPPAPTDHPRRCTWRSKAGKRCTACWVRKHPEQAEQERCHAHVQSVRDRQCTATRPDGTRCRSSWSESRDRQVEQKRCHVHLVPEMRPKKRMRRR